MSDESGGFGVVDLEIDGQEQVALVSFPGSDILALFCGEDEAEKFMEILSGLLMSAKTKPVEVIVAGDGTLN